MEFKDTIIFMQLDKYGIPNKIVGKCKAKDLQKTCWNCKELKQECGCDYTK